MATEATFTSRNQCSASALVIKQNSELEFIENPHKPGQLFFVCGNITGYVSPAITEKIDSISIDDIRFAEVSKDGGEYIPCLMMVGKNNPPKKVLGGNLLHKE